MPALRIADLFCLRFPAEATLTLVDWFDAHIPGPVGASGRAAAVASRLAVQMLFVVSVWGCKSALEHALGYVRCFCLVMAWFVYLVNHVSFFSFLRFLFGFPRHLGAPKPSPSLSFFSC